jgi:hypothetical protein
MDQPLWKEKEPGLRTRALGWLSEEGLVTFGVTLRWWWSHWCPSMSWERMEKKWDEDSSGITQPPVTNSS